MNAQSLEVTAPAAASPETADIAEALDRLHAVEAAISAATGPLQKISDAMAKAQGVVDAHAAAVKHLGELQDRRHALAAARFLGEADEAESANLEREIVAADARANALASDAEAAASAVETLNARYASAAAPVRALGGELARAKHAVLEIAAMALNNSIGEAACVVVDKLCEATLLARLLNDAAAAAGMSRVAEPLPVLQFSALPVGEWQLANAIAANPSQVAEARDRLTNFLRRLGVVEAVA
jgi:hypothetical protein